MSKEVQNISVDVLKAHPRNDEFFDDINGEEWERFKSSIRDDGVLSPIIVSPDMTIISGHQRAKAAREVGLTLVPIIINEDLADEGVKLRALIAANFGRTKNNESKQRKAIAEYVELCGYKNGDNQWVSHNGKPKLTLDEIAKHLGISKPTLNRALSIERNLTEGMKELLDTGVISKTLASDIIAGLTPQEQTELISNLDVTKKITQKEVQAQIDRCNELKKKNSELKSKFDNVSSLNDILSQRNAIAEHEKELYKNDSEEYVSTRDRLIDTKLTTDSECRIVDAADSISELNEFLQDLLQNKLAPIRYKDYIFVIKNNDGLRENFLNTLSLVKNWYNEMISAMEQEDINCNIIDKDDMNIIDMEE